MFLSNLNLYLMAKITNILLFSFYHFFPRISFFLYLSLELSIEAEKTTMELNTAIPPIIKSDLDTVSQYIEGKKPHLYEKRLGL